MRGAGTRLGFGLGVAGGETDGGVESAGGSDELDVGDGLALVAGPLDGGVLPSPASRPDPGAAELDGAAPSAANNPSPSPPRRASTAPPKMTVRLIGRTADRACG